MDFVGCCRKHLLRLLMIASGVFIALPVSFAEHYTADELLTMDIEKLVNVNVTTLSRREEKYMATAGAVFVITRDDIRRSGVRSIPDALRLAPGLQVSQTNANQFQIGIRGQADFFTDLLLVMVDGRPIYNTTFSGVWWVAQNYPLEDIKRIEIVRGPGGSAWGSNATNGVINIITKRADASKGLRISGGGGTEDRGFGNISFADSVGKVDYRLYAMNELRDGGIVSQARAGLAAGAKSPDFRRMKQQGFRMDWNMDALTRLSLHGDIYQLTTGVSNFWQPVVTTPAPATQDYIGLNAFNGKNMVLRIESDLSPDVTFKGQLFYDQYKVHTQIVREKKETFDGDLQIDFSNILQQDISLGMDIRRVLSHYNNTPQFQLPNRTTKLTSFFINDELHLFDGLFRITGGVKIERNSYTGWEYQPSVRAIVSNDNWAFWAAASRSARTPNDSENGMLWNLKSISGLLVKLTGSGQTQTENVLFYEVGGRLRPNEKSLIEFTAFKGFYKGVPDVIRGAPNFATLTIPINLTNVLNGKGEGIEANFRYQPWEWITLKGSYTYLHQNYAPFPVINAETIGTARSNKAQDPANRFHIGVGVNPVRNVELDANLYFTGPFRDGKINGNHRLDARLSWKPIKELDISMVGQDLLRASYLSNIDSIVGYASKIQQRYYLQATYHYK